MHYSIVHLEISGKCNARCHWCQTGLANELGHKSNNFMDYRKFTQVVEYLLEKGVINNRNRVRLFNWGEPLLHPRFKDIVHYLAERKIYYEISTNGSKMLEVHDPDDLNYLTQILFSMSGFSQESYDKGHRLNFERVWQNITNTSLLLRDVGFKGRMILQYHLYQHNLDEMVDAARFAHEHGLQFGCSYAYINDFERFHAYLEGTLVSDDMRRASRELFLSAMHTAESLEKRPRHPCKQLKFLHIDQDCNLIVCCSASRVLGNMLEIDLEKVQAMRECSPECARCAKNNTPYMVQNYPKPQIADILSKQLALQLDSKNLGKELYSEIKNPDLSWNSPVWKLPKMENGFSVSLADGKRHVVFDTKEPLYIKQDNKPFGSVPRARQSSKIAPCKDFRCAVECSSLHGNVKIYVICYSSKERLQTFSANLEGGKTVFFFKTPVDTEHFRMAIRVEGKGELMLSGIYLYENRSAALQGQCCGV